MSNTLKDDMKTDAANLFLNTDEFAEEVTFYPADGGASRTLTVKIKYRQRDENYGPISYDTEEIEVFVLKDESHEKGGIAEPQRLSRTSDQLVRSGDTSSERFAFTGKILSESAHGWVLEFARPKPIRIGTDHRVG